MEQMKPMECMARVTAVHRGRYGIWTENVGEGFARLKQSAFEGVEPSGYPTVGDLAHVRMAAGFKGSDSLIDAIAPRKSVFVRKRPFTQQGEQAVAANFDEVFIVTSLNREFSARRIERYAAQTWQSGGTPVVVLTKLDVAQDAAGCMAKAQRAAPGAEVYAVSSVTGEGLEALARRLSSGKLIALLGSSGVGKSSLVNALAGEAVMDTGEIRLDDARGRHTTTHRELIMLPCGAMVIDTPGMRELGLWDAEEGLKEAFGDVDALARGCRFGDCTHMVEPGCAVLEAIRAGNLEAERLKSYHKLQREAARRAKRR